MNDDYIFDEEVDEEAAAELERKKAEDAQRKAAAEAYQKSADYKSENNEQDPYRSYNDQSTYQNTGSNYSNGQYNYNNGPYSNGPYGNGPYNNGPYRNDDYYNGQRPKRTGTGPATASLTLGIISLVLFCSCANVITAVIAIIMGINYLKNYDLSVGKARAIAGIATAAISVVMLIVSYSMVSSNDNLENFLSDDFIQYYYNYGGSDDSIGDYEQYFNEFEGHGTTPDNTL